MELLKWLQVHVHSGGLFRNNEKLAINCGSSFVSDQFNPFTLSFRQKIESFARITENDLILNSTPENRL